MLSGKNLYRLHLSLFQTEGKKEKKKNRDSKGKSFSSLVLSEHDIPTIPCTLCVCVSARQKGKNLRVLHDEWGELLFLPFGKKSRISGRKCLLVSERTANRRNMRERDDAFEADHPTPLYPGVSFYIHGSPKVRKRRSCKFLQYPPVTS